MTRVVVIGAGVGGLGAATRLAGAGCDVTVVEASDGIGGKLNTEVLDGHTFDTGPSLMTMPFTPCVMAASISAVCLGEDTCPSVSMTSP